ncbi:transglutaminase-like domain-containing protein [Agrococcus terreus]|uniref:Transglutaminase-like domain-containing protein n=1 Tax=Agrococcus terreus TaxID=574649 RepID=A0ABQ2KLJ6_9MICO|nr:transglutaminase domain-containing protein [Agrococcus terreus]GGN87108.1 hypothetical protein GCM10010968_21300 [Agrococcus terreus]
MSAPAPTRPAPPAASDASRAEQRAGRRAAGRERRRRLDRAGAVETIALALLPLAWLWATRSVIEPDWLAQAGFAALGVALAAWLARQVLPTFAATVAAAVVGLVIVLATAGAEEAVLGVVPTPASFELAMATLADGVEDIAWALQTPIPAEGPVLAAVVAAAVVLALHVDLLGHALRVPAVAILFAAAPAALPLAFRIDAPTWDLVPGAIASALVLAAPAIDERLDLGRGALRAVALVVAAAAAASVLPLVAPSPREIALDLPTVDDLFRPVTPVLRTDIDLGDELRRPEARPVFTYSTTDGQPIATRLMTLPLAGDEGFVSVPPEAALPDILVEGAETGAPMQMTIRMSDVRAESLPVPDRATGAQVPEGATWDTANDALRLEDGTETAGLEYEASGSRFDDLEALPVGTGSTDHGAELRLPDAAGDIAARGAALVDEGMDARDRVLAVRGFMTDGLWNYSEQLDLPGFAGAGGDGWGALEGFLETRSGYCVHYASATTALLRGAGVASRVVVGFLPGDEISGGWAVSTNEMHAWAEAWVDGAGWVRVETTPGAGTGSVSPDGAEVTPSATPTPTPDESEAPTPTPTPDASDPAEPTPSASVGPSPDASGGPGVGPGVRIDPEAVLSLLAGLGVIALLLLPWGLRTALRALRLRRGPPGAWDELRATLADLGVRLPASATAGDVAEAIERRTGEPLTPAAERVKLAAERAAFDDGPRERAHDGDVQGVREALLDTAPPWRRALVLLLPPSLLGVVARDRDDEG